MTPITQKTRFTANFREQKVTPWLSTQRCNLKDNICWRNFTKAAFDTLIANIRLKIQMRYEDLEDIGG